MDVLRHFFTFEQLPVVLDKVFRRGAPRRHLEVLQVVGRGKIPAQIHLRQIGAIEENGAEEERDAFGDFRLREDRGPA